MSYAIVRQAILDRCCLSATYQGSIRHFAPHAIGQGKDSEANVMAFQYGGSSSKRLAPGGEWRCFRVAGLTGVRRNEDRWESASDHGRPNTCVTQIDVQVSR
jgi:hypothetical protein